MQLTSSKTDRVNDRRLYYDYNYKAPVYVYILCASLTPYVVT